MDSCSNCLPTQTFNFKPASRCHFSNCFCICNYSKEGFGLSYLCCPRVDKCQPFRGDHSSLLGLKCLPTSGNCTHSMQFPSPSSLGGQAYGSLSIQVSKQAQKFKACSRAQDNVDVVCFLPPWSILVFSLETMAGCLCQETWSPTLPSLRFLSGNVALLLTLLFFITSLSFPPQPVSSP